MMTILIFVLFLVTSGASHTVHDIQSTLKEDLELERQLKLINKPSIKSFHTKFGDIVDCIDINKQPAFDHPLLKNHKLQIKPSFQKQIGKTEVKSSSTIPIFRLDKDQCPTGTIPIRRTTKYDIIREKSLLNNLAMTQNLLNVHVAEVSVLSQFGPYYGVSGLNSIYNPRLDRTDQISLSQLWVQNGPVDTNNKITFGWHVLPQLYGDNRTHVYGSWTTDNYKTTGCFNVQCPGFVQISKEHFLGGATDDVSKYGGPIFAGRFTITQDPMTKNWWVSVNGEDIGYYPARLFSNMASADRVGWGGRTGTPLGTPSPPMGSGHFPDNRNDHACFFSIVSFQNASRQNYGPEIYQTQTFTDKPECFGVKYYGYEKSIGYNIQFGGPGGNCDN